MIFLLIFFFLIRGNPTPRKLHFVGPGERVKPRLSQALTRGARPDSNSRPAVQISSPLPSRYAHWGQFFFFWIRGNLTPLESALCGRRWGSKTPAVPGSYKRCTPWLELETCCANLKPFAITLHPLGTNMIYIIL